MLHTRKGRLALAAVGLLGTLGAAHPQVTQAQGSSPENRASFGRDVTPAQANALSAKCDTFLLAQLRGTSPRTILGHSPDHAIWGHSPSMSFQARAMTGLATGSNGYTSVVIRFSTPLNPMIQAQLQAFNSQIIEYLPMINSVAARVPTNWLKYLAASSFVQRLSSDVLVMRSDATTVGESGADTAFSQYGLTGQGVTVAVLDSGLRYSGQDLSNPTTGASRVLGGVSFVPGDSSTDDACGHGTHVAGIIAGNGADSGAFNKAPGQRKKAILGIARGVNLVNVRVLDKNGESDTFALLGGIQWVIDHKAQYGIRVINLSLGQPIGESCTTDPLCQAAEAAYRDGIVVVCAAGNYGRVQNTSPKPTPGMDNEGFGNNYGSILSPGNDPYVITVGAMKSVDGNRAHDRIATYSSRGPSLGDHILKPDLVAPGNQIVSLRAVGSTLDGEYPGNVNANSEYFTLSGTSMAAPVVSGSVALMLQANPSLTPDTVKARLMASADKWSDSVGNGTILAYGAGYLDIPAALNSPLVPVTAAVSPQLTEDAAGNVILDPRVADAHVVWGSNVVWGAQVVWGSHVVWGSNVIDASHVVWGSNVVWGLSTVDAAHVVWGSSFGSVDALFEALGDPAASAGENGDDGDD